MVYQISLYGENGKLINRKTITRSPEEFGDAHLVLDIDFKISGKAEAARLEISSVDPYYRVTAMETTDVILLAERDQINPVFICRHGHPAANPQHFDPGQQIVRPGFDPDRSR